MYKGWAFGLSTAGVLFSGYLSGVKFFAKTCAFNQSCPYFLGYPACYFGFAIFLALFIVSLMLLLGKVGFSKAVKINTWVSALGVLFAARFSYPEVRDMLAGTYQSWFLGLSTCVYGLIFFLAVFVISIWPKRQF